MAESPGGHLGGIAWLLELIEGHRSAIRMDFAKLGIDLDQLVRDQRWAVGVDLVYELQRDTGSHLFADLSDYAFVASHEAVATAMNATSLVRILQALCGDKQKLAPFPLPFRDKKVEVAAEEQAAAVAELEAGIVFN